MKPGDKIISDLDGLEYEVVQFGDRNDLEPLQGVKLCGNMVIVQDEQGNKQVLYEWEVRKK